MENIEVFKALFLGFIEGLTEFLPISSTGHLILFGNIIDFQSDDGRVFEVVIQLGAILAVCWLYRKKIFDLIKGFFSGDSEAKHFATSVIIAFIPAVVIGILAVDFIKQVLFSPLVVSIALIIGGLIIFWVESKQFDHKTTEATEINFKQALIVGFAQCVAMIPGTSVQVQQLLAECLRDYLEKQLQSFHFF